MNASSRPRHSRRHGTGYIFGAASAGLVLVSSIILSILYHIGDGNPVGETMTIFPPLLWVVPLLTITSMIVFARSWRLAILALASITAFVLLCEDYQSLFRMSPLFENKQGIRLITWNIAGRTDVTQMLADLVELEPDIIFMQECPNTTNAFSSTTLSGYWKDFHWYAPGDCGILSRYKLIPVSSEPVGPWDKPAVATIDVPGKDNSPQTLLLCNVRLMLPLLTTDAAGWFTDTDKRTDAHRQRVEQYQNLAYLIKASDRYDGVVLGGDFNVRGNSASLEPLRKAGIMDVWNNVGSGWGGTVLADFPMARIDQVWTSEQVQPRMARTHTGAISDHLMIVVDISITSK